MDEMGMKEREDRREGKEGEGGWMRWERRRGRIEERGRKEREDG